MGTVIDAGFSTLCRKAWRQDAWARELLAEVPKPILELIQFDFVSFYF